MGSTKLSCSCFPLLPQCVCVLWSYQEERAQALQGFPVCIFHYRHSMIASLCFDDGDSKNSTNFAVRLRFLYYCSWVSVSCFTRLRTKSTDNTLLSYCHLFRYYSNTLLQCICVTLQIAIQFLRKLVSIQSIWLIHRCHILVYMIHSLRFWQNATHLCRSTLNFPTELSGNILEHSCLLSSLRAK